MFAKLFKGEGPGHPFRGNQYTGGGTGGGDYEINHSTHSSAMATAHDHIKSKGYEISDDNWFQHISGTRKPSEGKTNSYNIPLHQGGKETNKYAHIQVYNRGNNVPKNYELNVYVDSGKPLFKADSDKGGSMFAKLLKYNPNHDPKDGKFTSGGAGGGDVRTGDNAASHEDFVNRLLANNDAASSTSAAPAKPAGPRPIHEIAREISKVWRKQGKGINYAAKPYLEALHSLSSASDSYGLDSGHSVLAYFMGNASTFRGPDAKRLKDELKMHMKTRKGDSGFAFILKGEGPGHPFRGNQYTVHSTGSTEGDAFVVGGTTTNVHPTSGKETVVSTGRVGAHATHEAAQAQADKLNASDAEKKKQSDKADTLSSRAAVRTENARTREEKLKAAMAHEAAAKAHENASAYYGPNRAGQRSYHVENAKWHNTRASQLTSVGSRYNMASKY